MRVNARFEGVAEKQVEYLAASTGMKVSDVLRESVDFYYRHVRSGGGQLKHLSAWIGKADSGQSDVASNVKKYLGESLEAKHAAAPAQASLRKPASAPRRATASPRQRAPAARKRPGPAA